MGLIIKDKLQAMMVGYPTVSDKYNVAGGILSGSTPVQFGDLVKTTSTVGYYAPATSVTLATLGGFVVSTNVKLADGFPGTLVQVNGGEAFNLLLDGYIAIALDASADDDYITPNADVYLILATGKCTTSDQAAAGTIVAIPGYKFTGYYELQGTTLVAEICVK